MSDAGGTYGDAVLADGPVAYWRLDGAGPTVPDEMGRYLGTIKGNVTTGIPYRPATAVRYRASKHQSTRAAVVRRGAGLEAVRRLAGHSKLEMTQRYAHATASDLRSAMAKLTK